MDARVARRIEVLLRAVLEQAALSRHAAAAVAKGEMGKVLIEFDDAVVIHELGDEQRVPFIVRGLALLGLIIEAVQFRCRQRICIRTRGRPSIDVPIGLVAEENLLGPSGQRRELLVHGSDLAGPSTDNSGAGATVHEVLVFEQRALKALLHEDQVGSIQCASA